jgi:hypothetical protein
MNPKASFGNISQQAEGIYPPLRGIVQLTNSNTLRFWNWSFTIIFNKNYHVVSKLTLLYVMKKTRPIIWTGRAARRWDFAGECNCNILTIRLRRFRSSDGGKAS